MDGKNRKEDSMKMSIPLSVQNTIDMISAQWQLNNLRPFLSGSTNNYVACAYSQIYKKEVVLKILLVNTHEPEALMLFDGNGCVKMLEYDPALKCFLLEYVNPGASLKTLFPQNDNEALKITADIIKKLHTKDLISQAIGFKTINQWLHVLHTFESKKIPAALLKKAQRLSIHLLALPQKMYVLHGDLHHENILQSGTNWIAIDPKGIIGPLEYEVGRFIMNPIPDLLDQQDAISIIKNRIDRFCAIFDFDRQQLVDWTFVQAVLSACWTENGGSELFFNYFIRLAEIIETF